VKCVCWLFIILWNKTPNLINREIFPGSLEIKHARSARADKYEFPIMYITFQRWLPWWKKTNLVVGSYLVTIWARGPDIIKYFRGFPRFLQVNTKITVLLGNKSLFIYYAQFIFCISSYPSCNTDSNWPNQPINRSINQLRKFRLGHLRKNKKKHFYTCAEFFIMEITAQWDKDGGRTLLGDNTCIRAIMLWPIMFQFFRVWISTCLPCIYIYNSSYVSFI
jgi:hypothetical protein